MNIFFFCFSLAKRVLGCILFLLLHLLRAKELGVFSLFESCSFIILYYTFFVRLRATICFLFLGYPSFLFIGSLFVFFFFYIKISWEKVFFSRVLLHIVGLFHNRHKVFNAIRNMIMSIHFSLPRLALSSILITLSLSPVHLRTSEPAPGGRIVISQPSTLGAVNVLD